MPNADNALLQIELFQTPVDFVALTDQGDYKEFRSAVSLWSKRSGFSPVVLPNGLRNGGIVGVAASGSNNVVDVTALTCYLAGALTSVNASADLAVARPTVSNYQKHSITVTAAGALAVVEGVEGSSFSNTRGAAGGPPWIDNDAIEIAQVWMDSQDAAAIAANEIYQSPGVHQERWDLPYWDVVYGEVENGILGYAGVNFVGELQQIHSEDSGTTVAGKLVYASYYLPQFTDLLDVYDYKPPGNTHSVNSTQVYGRVKGAQTSTLNPGSFNIHLNDGVTDPIIQALDKNVWFKFFADRLNTPYILCLGKLGMADQYPANANINAACTIAAETAASRVYG